MCIHVEFVYFVQMVVYDFRELIVVVIVAQVNNVAHGPLVVYCELYAATLHNLYKFFLRLTSVSCSSSCSLYRGPWAWSGS